MYNYYFHGVSEREMDILFLQAFGAFPDFLKLFTDQTEWEDGEYHIDGVELSKTDSSLGESDITVFISLNGEKKAILIENKIDAIAMPEQHERYVKRGKKAIKKDGIASFEVFIICPEKYYKRDAEAKKYEHYVSYEKCLEFFEKQKTNLGEIFVQQIHQALDSTKTTSKTEINEIAVQSFAKYINFQKENYPKLNPRNDGTSGKVNGWWPEFKVKLPHAIIIHKSPTGTMDLTFGKAAPKIELLENIASDFSSIYGKKIEAVVTGKSAALRIRVPIIQMGTPFEEWECDDLVQCFDAAALLMEMATFINNIRKFYDEFCSNVKFK